MFANDALPVGTRRAVYEATVLAVLLYGAETWTLMAPYVRRLTVFHNHCVRTILGITRYEQWQKHLTSAMLLDRFGIESISRIVMDKRLRWLGHVGRMGTTRLPNIMLFGEMKKKRPAHGPRKRWRDLVSNDLKIIGIDGWYELCQDRNRWYQRCREGISQLSPFAENICAANNQPESGPFTCQCGRIFCRAGDRTRHRRFCMSHTECLT